MNGPVLLPVATMRSHTVSPAADEILDREAEVGERPAQRRDDGPGALGAGSVTRAEILVLDELGRSERVHDL